jgi:hypothetical protein
MLDSFKSVSTIVVCNGKSTTFWFNTLHGDLPLQACFPDLLFHSTQPNDNVAIVIDSSLHDDLVPHLCTTAAVDLRALTSKLGTVALRLDVPDFCNECLTKKNSQTKVSIPILSDICRFDELATKVWRNAPPLKCKVFCWLARKIRLPTNEWRFRHHLSASAFYISYPRDEDTYHLILSCLGPEKCGTMNSCPRTSAPSRTYASRTAATMNKLLSTLPGIFGRVGMR